MSDCARKIGLQWNGTNARSTASSSSGGMPPGNFTVPTRVTRSGVLCDSRCS
jgi:hypothetical protein